MHDKATKGDAAKSRRACIRGMRVTVSLIVNLVASGMSATEVMDAYPYLEPEDIRQALQYAAWLADDAVYPLEKDAAH